MSDTDFGGWDGTERRGAQAGGSVPVALLQYMDARIAAHVARIEHLLREHTVDEMARYKEIGAAITAAAQASETRHAALLTQIQTLATRAEAVDAAFVPTASGPDYAGHRHDHSTRKAFGEWIDGTKRSVITKLIEWAAVVIVAAVVFKFAPHLLASVFSPGL